MSIIAASIVRFGNILQQYDLDGFSNLYVLATDCI